MIAPESCSNTSSSSGDDFVTWLIRRIKWSYNCLLERRGLKLPRFSKGSETTFFRSLPSQYQCHRCVNDVTKVCRGWIEASLQPTFTTHSSKTGLRVDFGLVAFFQSKTALSTAKVHFWVNFPCNRDLTFSIFFFCRWMGLSMCTVSIGLVTVCPGLPKCAWSTSHVDFGIAWDLTYVSRSKH